MTKTEMFCDVCGVKGYIIYETQGSGLLVPLETVGILLRSRSWGSLSLDVCEQCDSDIRKSIELGMKR